MDIRWPYSSQRNQTQQQSEPLPTIMFQLRQLHEVQDESRNQQCPIIESEQLGEQSRQDSRKSATCENVLTGLEDSWGQSKASRRLGREAQKAVDASSLHWEEVNRKLMEDNRKLFAEVLKLRSLLGSYQFEDLTFQRKTEDRESKKLKAELEKAKEEKRVIEQKVSRLVIENDQLRQQLLNMTEQQSKIIDQYKITKSQLHELEIKVKQSGNKLEAEKEENQIWQKRINDYRKEKSKNQTEKDRLISNMKVVHEAEVKKLKKQIQIYKRGLEDAGKSRY